MVSIRTEMPQFVKAISVGLLMCFVCMMVAPIVASAQEEDETISGRFDEVVSLRSQGRYDEAIAMLQGMIAEYAKSENYLRRAYSELVFTIWKKGDVAAATEGVREALSRFPDLTPDPMYSSERVNELYDNLRKQMFGSLDVIVRPDSCRVFLGDQFKGFTPLRIKYVKIGEYALNLSKSGYRDESTTVQIGPGSPTNVQLSLQRQRTKTWWLERVVAPAGIVAVFIAQIIIVNSKGTTEPSPLPEPPAPPTQ